MSAFMCAHCAGRVISTGVKDDTSYVSPAGGTWTHTARKSELDAGLIWCDTPEPDREAIVEQFHRWNGTLDIYERGEYPR